jgi:hypothetical protein
MGFSCGLFLVFFTFNNDNFFKQREPAKEQGEVVAVAVVVVAVQSSCVTKIEFHFSLNSSCLLFMDFISTLGR